MNHEPPTGTDPEPCAGMQGQGFENGLQHLSSAERMALARTVGDPVLTALCFDPLPQVISSLLENPRFGPLQARTVAHHHRSAAGLEALGHTAFLQDDGVRRGLLRNPILPLGLFQRGWAHQRLLVLYQVAVDRELAERTRSMAKDLLRSAFHLRTAEEQVELILITEGRCLVALGATALDARATALLCQRPMASVLLIENLARWSATPPPLITHLRRQEVVRRNPALRRLLERHPNAQGPKSSL